MKHKALLIVIFLSAASLSEAQILIGPTAGGHISWVSFGDKDHKDLYRVKPLWGFHAGVNLSFRVRRRFFLHSSFIYSQKGKIIQGKEDPLLRNKVRYHYIELPILYTVEFKAQVGKSKEFKWYVGGGPTVSYWLGGKGEIYEEGIEENNISEEPIPYKIVFNKTDEGLPFTEMNVNDPNRIQLGINIATGIVFEPFGYQKFMLMARWEIGHSFMSKTGSGFFSATDTYRDVLQARNNALRLSLAYLIDLKTDQRKKGKSTINKKNL